MIEKAGKYVHILLCILSVVQCQVPSSYDNGEITPSDSNSVVGAYYYEETFTLTCNSGYNLGSPDKTSVVISCQADGSLSEPNAECKRRYIGAVSLETLSLGSPTKCDTIWDVIPKKMARGLKFRI